MNLQGDLSQGWYLTTLSSLLCALGCFIVFLDDLYVMVFPKCFTNRFPFHLKENYKFMNGSLGFSAGCLLFTALYRLLPEARTYLDENSDESANLNLDLILAFIAGIMACILFNQALHFLTAESVVHCSHDGENKIETVPISELTEEGHSHSHNNHEHAHSHTVHDFEYPESNETQAFGPTNAEMLEQTPLLARKKSLLIHYLAHGEENDRLLGECKGYSSAELCLHDRTRSTLHFCELPQITKDLSPHAEDDLSTDVPEQSCHPVASHRLDVHSAHDIAEHHHHHVNSPLSRLMLIGIQTILAITLHKLPEGFITYITLETNPELGVSIFLSLLIHNFTEGFSMCLPLYYLFALGRVRFSKWKAVGISAVLGGFSQPLGALGGYVFMKVNHAGSDDIDIGRLNFVFGVTMAVTSGFLSVIAFSMYGSAVSFSGSPNFVMVWCIIGMCVIGLLTIYLGD